jgi:hypothetical protein
MRVRDHVALSTAAAAVIGPRIGRPVLGLWAASVLIDADHYLWFLLRRRRLSPVAAVRFFNQAHAPHHRATRMFHSPLALLAVALVGVVHRRALAVAVGMGMHVAMDAHHEARLDKARAVALERDQFSCRQCGIRAPNVGAHLERQPRLLPSYRPENLISLCGPCHEAAHALGVGSTAWK